MERFNFCFFHANILSKWKYVFLWLDFNSKNADAIAKLHVHLKSSLTLIDENPRQMIIAPIGTIHADSIQIVWFPRTHFLISTNLCVLLTLVEWTTDWTRHTCKYSIYIMHDDTRWSQVIVCKALLSKRQETKDKNNEIPRV